jgi:hypothetical protein
MRNRQRVCVAILIVLFSVVCAFSQDPGIQPPGPALEKPVFITGQVVLADGTPFTESVTIQITCDTWARTETYTDLRGSFSFDLSRTLSNSRPQPANSSADAAGIDFSSWKDCVVQAMYPGFSSERLDFRISPLDRGVVDVGKVRMHQLNPGAGSSLSVTSMAAPKRARKAFEKGFRLEREAKWSESARQLKEAVETYPQYAAAWEEMGRVQYINHDFVSARHSFEQAMASDPKYIKPYLGLAQLAMDAQQWQELVNVSGKALTLNSADFPGLWLLNALGHYQLHHYDTAEKSTRNGMQADSQHRVQGFEVLLGKIQTKLQTFVASHTGLSRPIRLGIFPEVIAESSSTEFGLH